MEFQADLRNSNLTSRNSQANLSKLQVDLSEVSRILNFVMDGMPYWTSCLNLWSFSCMLRPWQREYSIL